MSPLQFEAQHQAEWLALARVLDDMESPGRRLKKAAPADAAGAIRSYRRACEHLALAQARAYPLHLAERLGALVQRAHRLVYRSPPRSAERLRLFVTQGFPRTLRANRRYLLAAVLAFGVPLLALMAVARFDPAFALTVLDASQLARFDDMYGDDAEAFGRHRDAETDWSMFGHYVRNNISVAFQCFATGLLLGVGSLFFLAYNGLLIGTVAGYLMARGLGHNFWSFVATHSAFELTAIVISGAAGLRLGHALLAPGRHGRGAALRLAAADGAVLVGGAALMLLAAAVVEAFWSSARWVPPTVKYGAAALCWAGVGVWLWRGGRGTFGRAAAAEGG